MADRGRVGLDRVCNRALHKRLVKKQQDVLKAKLAKIKVRQKGGNLDTLDNRPPETQSLQHIKSYNNAKKNEFLKMREDDINNVNHLLLEGIARNKVEMVQTKAVAPRALTALRRIRELEHISKNNEFLVHRLSLTRGTINAEEFRAHELDHQNTLRKMSRNGRVRPDRSLREKAEESICRSRPITAPSNFGSSIASSQQSKGSDLASNEAANAKLFSAAYKVVFSNIMARSDSAEGAPTEDEERQSLPPEPEQAR